MQTRVLSLGGLTVRTLEEEGARPELNLVLCHGFGAPGEDLVGLGAELLASSSALAGRLRCVFPAAPLSLEDLGMWGGRAWWHLDLERLLARRDWQRLMEEVPEGLQAARGALEALLAELGAGTGLGMERTVLGGFSQGAMLSVDVALRSRVAPAGLCILSGALVARPEWEARAPARKGLPVFQSHGQSDDILPFAGAEALRALLERGGLDVEFTPFPGPHTITSEVVERLAHFLEARLGAAAR